METVGFLALFARFDGGGRRFRGLTSTSSAGATGHKDSREGLLTPLAHVHHSCCTSVNPSQHLSHPGHICHNHQLLKLANTCSSSLTSVASLAPVLSVVHLFDVQLDGAAVVFVQRLKGSCRDTAGI